MAFSQKNMSVIAYANGYTLWCYNTRNGYLYELMEVLDKSYRTLVAHGDAILVSCLDFSGIVSVKFNESTRKFELAPMDSFEVYKNNLSNISKNS